MINRIAFLNSISGIQYPEMLVNFFDQFIALKQLVEDYGKITVIDSTNNSISFRADFTDKSIKDKAMSNINTNSIIIYGRPISIQVNTISDTEINVVLQ